MHARYLSFAIIILSITTSVSQATQRSLTQSRSPYNHGFSSYSDKDFAKYALWSVQIDPTIMKPVHTNSLAETALHVAIKSDMRLDGKDLGKHYRYFIEWLLRKGCDVNASNKDGETAIHYAARGVLSLISLPTLLYYGADINAKDNNGATGLIRAVRSSCFFRDHLTQFIAAGAHLNSKDKKGNTALFYAVQNSPGTTYAERNSPDNEARTAVELLIYAGADVDSKNNEDKRAIDVADSAYIALLVAAGSDPQNFQDQLEKVYHGDRWHDSLLASIAIGFTERSAFKDELNGRIVRSSTLYLRDPDTYSDKLADCLLERFRKIKFDTYQPDCKTREKFRRAYEAMKDTEKKKEAQLKELDEKKRAEQKELALATATVATISSVPQQHANTTSTAVKKSLSPSDLDSASDDESDGWFDVADIMQ